MLGGLLRLLVIQLLLTLLGPGRVLLDLGLPEKRENYFSAGIYWVLILKLGLFLVFGNRRLGLGLDNSGQGLDFSFSIE